MKKVIREISVRRKRNSVRIIGYSATDRGTKYPNKVYDLVTDSLNQTQIDALVRSYVDRMVEAQLETIQDRMDKDGSGE